MKSPAALIPGPGRADGASAESSPCPPGGFARLTQSPALTLETNLPPSKLGSSYLCSSLLPAGSPPAFRLPAAMCSRGQPALQRGWSRSCPRGSIRGVASSHIYPREHPECRARYCLLNFRSLPGAQSQHLYHAVVLEPKPHLLGLLCTEPAKLPAQQQPGRPGLARPTCTPWKRLSPRRAGTCEQLPTVLARAVYTAHTPFGGEPGDAARVSCLQTCPGNEVLSVQYRKMPLKQT